MRTTHTYAVLAVSPPAFNEIAQRMKAAGSEHAFMGGHPPKIDMHGIAVAPDMDMKPGEVYIETRSILSSRTKEGMVSLRLNDQIAQMDIAKAKEVAMMLLGAIEAAGSDQILYTFMREKVGLDEEKAGNVMLDFRELRHGSRS